MTWRPALGAIADASGGGTHFRLWAPDAEVVELVLEPSGRRVPMVREADGYVTATTTAPAGTLYRYRVDGRGPFPDPASRFQPQGVHGPSQVVDPHAFPWSDADWRVAPDADLVLYELHVGTFTQDGTFDAAAARLPWLVDLGVTAVELMPVADFPGGRNWGYDGVAPFAPARCYGSPDDLRRFVDAAHACRLAVHLDVVYNHFGPDGAYQGTFSRAYYSVRHRSPWGDGINFDGPGSEHVRRYVIENALHWLHEYHVDGLRLDATHAIVDESPVHIVAELATAIHESPRGRTHGAMVVAEDHRNLASIVRPRSEDGWGADAVWSDDPHHQVRRALTGDSDGYFADFTGSGDDLATTLRDGWFFRGQEASYFGGPRGSDPGGLPLARFVTYLQNHDQVGNRAFGERLTHDVTPGVWRALSTLFLLLPQSLLLFMGQEWAAGTPFRYFTDHPEPLGRAVTDGRRREFRRFDRFLEADLPDPQGPATFAASRLDWLEPGREPHAGTLRLYRRLLTLRRTEPALQHPVASGDDGLVRHADGALILRRTAPGARDVLVVARLAGDEATDVSLPVPGIGRWSGLLTSDDAAYETGAAPPELLNDGQVVRFARPGAMVVVSTAVAA